MRPLHTTSLLCIGMLSALISANAQQQPGTQSAPAGDLNQTLEKLLIRLAADESRIKELEEKLAQQTGQPVTTASGPAAASSTEESSTVAVASAPAPNPAAPMAQSPSEADASADSDPHAHMVELPGGGPTLKIRGYFDFNFGVGTDANPLIFPLGVPPHTHFSDGRIRSDDLVAAIEKTQLHVGNCVWCRCDQCAEHRH